jgi:hypothetical protein
MNSKQLHTQIRLCLGLTGLLVLVAGSPATAIAADTGTANAVEDLSNIQIINVTSSTKPRGFASGQRVYIDAETKEIREATLEDIYNDAAAENTDNRKSAKAQSAATYIGAKAGALGARLSPEYHSYSVMTLHSDGTLSEVCVTSKDAAEKAAADGAATLSRNNKGANHDNQ